MRGLQTCRRTAARAWQVAAPLFTQTGNSITHPPARYSGRPECAAISSLDARESFRLGKPWTPTCHAPGCSVAYSLPPTSTKRRLACTSATDSPLYDVGGEALRLVRGSLALMTADDRTTAPVTIRVRSDESTVETTKVLGLLRDALSEAGAPRKSLEYYVRQLGDTEVGVRPSLVSDPCMGVVVDTYFVNEEDETSDVDKERVGRSVEQRFELASVGTPVDQFLDSFGLKAKLLPQLDDISLESKRGMTSPSGLAQSTNEVLMVVPAAFESNTDAAQDNYFMAAAKGGLDIAQSTVRHKVLQEYGGLLHELRDVAGVQVRLFAHDERHGTPDAIFPNNWFSTHQDGTFCLYPMKVPNRRKERRQDIVDYLLSTGRYNLPIVDLTEAETANHPQYLEGTGSIVIDHVNSIAYLAASERSNVALAQEWAQRLGMRELVYFDATDAKGHPIYHTNVVMAIGSSVAIVCTESVPDAKERQHLVSRLSETHEIVEISRDQMDHFCGNALEVQNGKGLPVLAMSTNARDSFTDDQRKRLLKHVAAIHAADIPLIEEIGGGGVRCAIAELF
mmetsp:Transcript_1413/g.4899  ORF Transcript_1413/g.4899 Transcript_1413/m.4899 type:complete len:565 (+) Transcript_1413:75-1769(+)